MMNPIDDASIEDEKEGLLNQLKTFDGMAYFFQKATLREKNPMAAKLFEQLVHSSLQEYERNGLPVIQGMNLDDDVKHYTYDELKFMTKSFNQYNCIYRTRYGRLFRGQIQENESELKNVMVKTWDFSFPPNSVMEDHPARFHDELRILMDSKIKSDSNVVKLIGFHCEQTLAVVYDVEGSLKKNRLVDIIRSDNFDWDDRMKVATAVGSVLTKLHGKNLVQGGVSTEDILVDQAYDPMIFNFRDRGDYGTVSQLSLGSDVCAFAHLLLELINKGSVCDRMLSDWISHGTLGVQNSFDIDKDLFFKIKELTMQCFKEESSTTIVTFVDDLKNLLRDTLPNKRPRVGS